MTSEDADREALDANRAIDRAVIAWIAALVLASVTISSFFA